MGWFEHPVSGRIIEAVIIAVVIAAVLGVSRWVRAFAKERAESDDVRLAAINRLLEYHEGSPADPEMGIPARPGIQERFERIEHQVTPNGGNTDSLGDRSQRTERLALAAVRQNEVLMEMLLEHLADGKSIMEIGVLNDENVWAALRAQGIELPNYIRPPDDIVFGPEDLARRRGQLDDEQGGTDG